MVNFKKLKKPSLGKDGVSHKRKMSQIWSLLLSKKFTIIIFLCFSDDKFGIIIDVEIMQVTKTSGD